MLCCYVSDYTQNGMKDRCMYAFDFATVGRMSEVGCLEWRDNYIACINIAAFFAGIQGSF